MNTKFGVELEFLGMGNNFPVIADLLTSASGLSVTYNSSRPIYWTVKSDGSVCDNLVPIVCRNPGSRGNHCGDCLGCRIRYGAELVSPPLPYNEDSFLQVYQICEALSSHSARINKTCGLHVHVDASFITRWMEKDGRGRANDFFQYAIDKYAEHEDLFDAFMAPSRRNSENEYCASMKGLRYTNSLSRYHKLNVQSFLRHRTIEFRQHHGSINADEIVGWIKTCVSFLHDTKASYELERNIVDASLHSADSLRLLTL